MASTGARAATVALGLVILALGGTGAEAQARAEIRTDPPLTPSFARTVHDYTVRCDGAPVEVTVTGGPELRAGISGQPGRSRNITRTVDLAANQALTVLLTRPENTKRYHVRCLPDGFPHWDFDLLRETSHRFYAVTPNRTSVPFVVLFDRHGVPVWWHRTQHTVFDAKVLPHGRIAYVEDITDGMFISNGYVIQDLGGRIRRIVSVVGGTTDIHDLQRLPNGDFLILSYKPRAKVDLTAYGGGRDDTVLDAVIQQIDREGRVVWSWNSKDHVSLEETGRWWSRQDGPFMTAKRDIVHINAVEPAGSHALLISLRHTDAIYKIDKRTGDIIWKLGGTPTPNSLEVRGDPHGESPLGGPHDPRVERDGTITVHDNGTGLDRAPRAVRYRIDGRSGTATLLEQVEDPKAPSFCCGSARRDADGSWLLSWGGLPLVTEFDERGRRTFSLDLGGEAFSYRAVAAPDGVLHIRDLRRAMTKIHGTPEP